MRLAFARPAAPVIIALSIACLGCSHAQKSDSAPRSDRTLITQAQILAHRFTNAYEAVEALHSNWLHAKGTNSFSSPSEVRVYVDDTSLGNIETLKSITAPTIRTIQHFDGLAATARWGLDHGAGVILITTHQ
jgi:hypothetical protein